LLAELSNFRHEAEKRLAEKDEEIEAIRWVNQINKYNNSPWPESASELFWKMIRYCQFLIISTLYWVREKHGLMSTKHLPPNVLSLTET
jgi:hypothetical protein